jgi:hypothetical protein
MKLRYLVLSALLVTATWILATSKARALNPAVQATVMQTAPIPESQVPKSIRDAVNAPSSASGRA